MWVILHPDGAAATTLSGELDRCITELAVRLADRVPGAVGLIEDPVRVDIPELITDARDDAQTSRQPISAITHARRLAQQGARSTR